MKKKIFISTGGSGGHVLPAITIYDHLKSNYEILISSDLRGLKYIDKENYKPIIINTPKLNNLFLLPFALSKILFLTFKCFILLKKEKIKIFLIEPNMVIGRANRFFLNFSEKLLSYSKNLINFPKGMKQKQIIIRPLIRKKYYEIINYEKKDSFFTIIIIGGSQGAKIFDTLINEILVNISNKHSIKVIHQTSE